MNYKGIIGDSLDHKLPSAWPLKVVQNVTQVDANVWVQNIERGKLGGMFSSYWGPS